MRERELLKDIHLFILSFESAVEAGYDSEQGIDFRAQLGAEVDAAAMTRAAAAALLPWAEALAAYLREAQEDEEQWDCGKGGHRFMSPQDEHCNVCNDWVGAVEP
jgi:hypothetical protein